MKKLLSVFLVITLLSVYVMSIADEVLETPWDVTWGMNQQDYIQCLKQNTGITAEMDEEARCVIASGNALEVYMGSSVSSMIAGFSQVKQDQAQKLYIDKNAGLNSISVYYSGGISSFKTLLEKAISVHESQNVTDYIFSVEDDSGELFFSVDTRNGNMLYAQLEDACSKWKRVVLSIAWGNYTVHFYMSEVYPINSANIIEEWSASEVTFKHSADVASPIPYPDLQ